MKKNSRENILHFIRKTNRSLFTTRDLTALSGKSPSAVVQSLNYLVRQGHLMKLARGVWGEAASRGASPFEMIPHLFPRQRVYVSFISALHLHGMIEQIPQTVTLASTAHTSTLRTRAGIFSIHQIAPAFFFGFDWYKGEGNFLIAEPEKALIDSLYLSSRKKKQFGYFPELHFPAHFSFKKSVQWAKRIPSVMIRRHVLSKLEKIKEAAA